MCIYHSLKYFNILTDAELDLFKTQKTKLLDKEKQTIFDDHKIVFIENLQDLFGYITFNEDYDEIYDKWDLSSNYKFLFINEEHCEPLIDIKMFINDQEYLVDVNDNIILKYSDMKKLLIKLKNDGIK